MSGGLADRFERQAHNEALYREVNERIALAGERELHTQPGETIEFLCECGVEGGCGERVSVPSEVYERVRSQDDRFVVKPGHETPDLEYAIDWTDEYVIVDKVAAAEWIVDDDPRGAPSA